LSQQVAEPKAAVKLNEDYCSRCSICRSLCPYDAITKDTESGKIVLEIEKCQVCGICYSACPAKAIDIIYYDYGSLVKYLEATKQKYSSDTLVIMCKGSAPDFAEVERLFGVSRFIPLSVPCVGRIPEELLLKALAMGINKIHLLACDENYCRFDRGSPLTGRRILALNRLLEHLGYGREAITLKRNGLKVKVDKDLCIACGNCVAYCPYNAPKLESGGGISFDLNACRGCGLCVSLCPAFALDLDNWERDRILNLIPQLLAEVKSPKILVFRCQWAVFPPLDGELSPNIGFIELPCAGRVDAFHILEALQKGADGVLILACSEDDCKQEGVSARAEHLVAKLKERLDQIGFQDRLHFCSVSPRYPEQVDEELRQFRQSIEAVISERKSK
jgi:coenzyme F420-reducing hydrogenase delta subunit/formate hydrogenlyase subunit 6/NADH:ubiquinone oxidoreductase subunit I